MMTGSKPNNPGADDDDSDSSSTSNVPNLQPRRNINNDGDSISSMPGLRVRGNGNGDDSSSSSDDGPPPLINRNDCDSSSSFDNGPPPLIPRIDYNSSSSSDNGPPPLINRNDCDSSSSSDNGPPPLIPRIDYDTSSDDDSMTEMLMPMSTRRKKAKGPEPFGNHLTKHSERAQERQRKQERKHREAEQREQKRDREYERKRVKERERKREAAKRKKKERKQKKTISATRIASFIRNTTLAKRWKRLRSGTIRLQALWRGIQTRNDHAGIVHKMEEFRRFYNVWGNCLKLTPYIRTELPDWASLRDQQAFIRQLELEGDDDGEEQRDTAQKLASSMEEVMEEVKDEKPANEDDDIEEIKGLPPRKNSASSHQSSATESLAFKKIHLSAEVVKWLKNGDPRYVDFFVRRMKQLSSGERSRILAKRLNGSTTAKVPIYETYLEQKSGFRILWTEKDDYLLVWYVAKHHRVSRLMRLIDDSKNRSERQRISINDIDEMNPDAINAGSTEEKDEIVLDPLGNVPLKIYDVGTDEIENITKQDWTPALHLTEEERRVVETEGTVLLLGRSGTGKTICICSRMEFDWQQHAGDPFFSQLFVARSPRLCTYVKKSIGPTGGSKFVTFDRVLTELENALPKVDGIRDSFPEDLFMKFSTFKRDVYDGSKGVDALIVWTNIRSFIKGSIEALQNNSNTKDFFVSEDEFLSETNFGKKRCRLATKQRKIVYEIFLSYKEKLAETNAWDNCDRIVALVQRLVAAKTSHPDLFDGLQSWCKWSKIYIDEVQDYVQSEILLFFHLSGPGNLFLAGDPAQNVTKGVEFRFDDIRSVGYHIAGENRKLIPQKPKIVNINFRSHAGILNAAASILSQMFAYFPDSAKQLGRDDGLFKGPRPGMFHKIKPETMAELLSKRLNGTVVLTHDECVEEVVEKLGGYELVYGIRKAKGLEFKNVIIVDFFSSLPNESQKPWR
jgi:hypothetical protein